MMSGACITRSPAPDRKRWRRSWHGIAKSWLWPSSCVCRLMHVGFVMADEQSIARYRQWYRKLLRCYSRPYREQFGESMEQTFNDLCRERVKAGKGLLAFVVWMFVETGAGIVRENGISMIKE